MLMKKQENALRAAGKWPPRLNAAGTELEAGGAPMEELELPPLPEG